MQRFVYTAVLSAILVISGCATTGGSSGTGAPPAAKASKDDQNRITAAEIAYANLPNAYELVSRLRRAWLRSDPITGGTVTVYMDDRKVGGAETLREIPAVTVAELRLVRNKDAIMRWSPDIEGSVIVVVPRR